MRILTVVNELGPGGTERVAQNCAAAYRSGGHDSAVLAYSAGGRREEPLRRAGVVLFVGGPDGAGIRRAVEGAATWGADVVHVHRPGGTDGLGALLDSLERGRRLPVVETSHFARADYSPDRRWVDVHIQISAWCMWQWRRWTALERPRPLGVIVPHMVRGDAFFPVERGRALEFRDAHGIPRDAVLFGRLGQAFDVYFPEELFRAFALAAETDERMWLAVVGAPDSVESRIAALKPSVAARVKRIGFIHGDEALRACYSALDAFLHVTRIGETFGLVLCESMLCGTPVITLATPAKGNAQVEVVGDERGGLVAADVPAVARCMARLAGDPGLASELGARGREWVARELNPERVTRMLLTVLELAAGAPDRGALERGLAAHPELRQDVPGAAIRGLMEDMEGRAGLKQRLLMRAATNPVLYRLYDRLRRPAHERGKFARHV